MNVMELVEEFVGYSDDERLSPEQRIMIDSSMPDFAGIATRLLTQTYRFPTSHVRETSFHSDALATDQWLDGELRASHAEDGHTRALWFFRDSWAMISTAHGNLSFVVVAPEAGTAEDRLAQLKAHAPPRLVAANEIDMDFCYSKGSHIAQVPRRIVAPAWKDIADNYSSPARKSLSELMAITPADITTGRLLVMQGPPGTGKTTAIRSLAREWNPWCRPMYVVDPDEMFGHASYLIEVALGQDTPDYLSDSETQKDWRLLVVEDAEEFLVPDSKDRIGQALARLLNLGDGLIGAGLRMLILLTTNAPLGALHSAITRPGRCLANIEVPKLTSREAAQWSQGLLDHEATLAELFEATGRKRIISDVPHESIGQYL